MSSYDLWKYCIPQLCNEYLLSLNLLGLTGWSKEKQTACLYAVSNHTERHYISVMIPKKNGGCRKLQVPDPMLKRIQRNILQQVLNSMPVSSYARAYYKGADIVSNARSHVGRKQVLKLDILDFFGSITYPMVLNRVFSQLYFPPSAGNLLTSLCCCRESLPQGAPTSPAVSNLVMKPFDEYMGFWCEEQGITYTRYCDDMTFSGDFDPGLVRRKAAGFLKEMGFELNHKKTRVLPSCCQQMVTGIVVNCRPQISREYRNKLRQEIYYCCRFGPVSHLEKTGDSKYLPLGAAGPAKYLCSLLGKISFVLQADPLDTQFRKAEKQVADMLKKLRAQETIFDV